MFTVTIYRGRLAVFDTHWRKRAIEWNRVDLART